MICFYDSHAHLHDACFARDLDLVLRRAEDAGVQRIITVGTDLESSQRAVQLAEAHAAVFAAVGWHPNHAAEAPADVRPALRALAQHPKVVAIGEVGLDYFHLPSKRRGTPEEDDRHKARQHDLFRQQLELAAEMGLNCVVHQRDALEAVLGVFEPFAPRVRGQFHCFVDQAAALRRVLSLGSIASFTGVVTFKNAGTVRETLIATPLDCLMVETDCPYLAPDPYRGKRCEPAHVGEIAAAVARVKGISLEALSAATCATAHHFFPKLSPP